MPAPKVICTVTNDLSGDRRMIRTCRYLVESGFDVTLVGRKLHGSLPLENEDFDQVRLTCFFNKGKLFYLEYNLRLLIYLARQNLDVLCSVDLDTSLAGRIIKGVKRVKWIVDSHEWFPFVPEVERRKSIQWFWLKIEKMVMDHADKVYTVGEEIAKAMKVKYNRDVGVVRNTPPLLEWESNKKSQLLEPVKKPFILYQGALNEGRGLERLVLLISQVNFDLVFIGDGDIADSLKQLVDDQNLGHKVHFLGFVPPSCLQDYTRFATLGYNVSEPISESYRLSLNNKFFDYVHAELPSLINDFPEYQSLVNEFEVGLLCSNSNDEIVKKLNELWADPSKIDFMRVKCREAKKKWNWENEAPKLKDIYKFN